MIASMTAFARVERSDFQWEVRSVNHRYLDVSFRLPDVLQPLEPELRVLAKDYVTRGKLDASLKLLETSEEPTLEIDEARLENLIQLADQARDIAARHELPAELTLADLLRWPGVLRKSIPNQESLDEAVVASFKEALEQLQTNRSREGRALAELFQERLATIQALLESIASATANQSSLINERLQSRIQKMDGSADPIRVAQEVAMLAQRADIREELDRLQIHVDEFGECVLGETAQGRRLSFLVQEMAREANTVAAKVVVETAVQETVELKVLIDQIREQVQNVE